MYTIVYFITSTLFLTESLIIKKKLDERNFFNITIQENHKIAGQNQNPVVKITGIGASSKKIFGGNLIYTEVSAQLKITENIAHHVLFQFPKPDNTEMIIIDGTYDAINKVFISNEISTISADSSRLIITSLIVLKQENPPTYVLTSIAYREKEKINMVKSDASSKVSEVPTEPTLREYVDFEISFVDNMKAEKPRDLEFKIIGSMYVANFDLTIKVTNKKQIALNNIALTFYLSSKIGTSDILYKLVKPVNAAAECDTSFPNVSPESILNGVVETDFAGTYVYVLKCKHTSFAASAIKDHKIRGSVSTSIPLANGTMFFLGLSAVLAGKEGNSPWGYSLMSSTTAESIPLPKIPTTTLVPIPTTTLVSIPTTNVPVDSKTTLSPNGGNSGSSSSKKGPSNATIAGVIIGVALVLGLVFGITFFIIKKKEE